MQGYLLALFLLSLSLILFLPVVVYFLHHSFESLPKFISWPRPEKKSWFRPSWTRWRQLQRCPKSRTWINADQPSHPLSSNNKLFLCKSNTYQHPLESGAVLLGVLNHQRLARRRRPAFSRFFQAPLLERDNAVLKPIGGSDRY